MIAYLPFTHVPERDLRALCARLGLITLYAPDQALAPDHLRKAAETGEIDLRYPPGGAPGRLLPAIEAYRQWAHCHQDHLVDLAAFIKATHDDVPLMDETNPSQIRTQIRKIQEAAVDEVIDPLFQAILYLALAQEYDQQQEAMHRELGAVQAMERDMLAQLSGDGEREPGTDFGAAIGQSPGEIDPGGYMTASRVEAWCRLAASQEELPQVFLTGSPAVMEHLRECLPEARKVAETAPPIPADDDEQLLGRRRDALLDLAQSSAPRTDLPEGFDDVPPGDAPGLTIFRLDGISPRRMLKRLCTSGSDDFASPDRPGDAAHTLFGSLARTGW